MIHCMWESIVWTAIPSSPVGIELIRVGTRTRTCRQSFSGCHRKRQSTLGWTGASFHRLITSIFTHDSRSVVFSQNKQTDKCDTLDFR